MNEHRTEAACLLQDGALYRNRIGLEPTDREGDLIFAGFKAGAFSLYFGDAPIYHFDLEGRWQRAYLDGLHYLKGLDGTVHAIDRVREGPNLMLHRRKLAFGEAADLDAHIRSLALDLDGRLDSTRLHGTFPPVEKATPLSFSRLHDFLESISRWDPDAWFRHREQYTAVYGPLPFLPPDSPGAVVVQATLGHADGHTFALAKSEEFYKRNYEEFAQHVRDVAALWGRRLAQARSVFLAGDDVLHQPVSTVEAYLEAIASNLPSSRDAFENEIRIEGAFTFLDDFDGIDHGVDDWRRLANRGLLRVNLGVESGDTDIREIYEKSWKESSLREIVSRLKAAGIGASVLTLVGAGGPDRAESHVEQTARLVESLDLGRGDFVFLLDQAEIRDSEASPTGFRSLQSEEKSEQQRRMIAAMAPMKRRGVKVLPYRLEKQGI